MDPAPDLLDILETYYDAAPRPAATVEHVGPFTLFRKTDPAGCDFYARPRLGLDVPFVTADVEQVRDRQRETRVPEAIEWVHEHTPSLLAAARADGMHVQECPLLVLPADPSHLRHNARRVAAEVTGRRVEMLLPDSPSLGEVIGAINAGFSGTDDFEPSDPGRRVDQMRAGLLAMVGAYDETGAVTGGGTHSPRGVTTELTGIAVLPRARRQGVGASITAALFDDAKRRGVQTIFLGAQDEAVARVYERVGFVRVGTACIAEPLHAPSIDG